MGLRVQKEMCATCVYRPGSPLVAKELEAAVADGYGGFKGSRICHSSRTAVCNGFWNRHKDKFPMGQIAQRLNMVEFVQDDVPTRISKSVKLAWAETTKPKKRRTRAVRRRASTDPIP